MASNNNNNSNRTVVPEAKAALNQMKLEIANELGMSNYQQVDKGNLTARENGYVGGYMTKKLVEMAEQQMAGKQQQ
ncbi:alpha/beta-type small acid-soluble spore protein [Asaccharospora irregularis]|uniref:Small, acid-soluble spore protein, alpha/beta type n=1 Tax=Asaccharospora irregularis DSM 2635 TaxID=1121321 RepID=A0A1M5MLG2_9FIRM|nr:alpha/beta-type small acid-soluble spore protein [Asaccharospora irregularis]SHG78264.1 Small, acid-soluble spore protein, alpha/beta type [Asaccharospora irregularis DSM 2635]